MAHEVTRPNPTLHAVYQTVDLRPLLSQIRGLGRSADTPEERAIGATVTAAELRLNMRSTTPTGMIALSTSAAERGEEDMWED